LQVNASDPDSDQVVFFDNTLLFDINLFLGTINFTPKAGQAGVYNITITATDLANSTNTTFQLTIESTNDPPRIDFIQPSRAPVGELFSLQVNATDPDNDTLQFFDNTELFNITGSGLINFTPVVNDTGVYFIDITVSDSQVNRSRLFNLVVSGADNPPIVQQQTIHL